MLLLLAFSASLVAAQHCPAGSLPANQVIKWTDCPLNTEAPLESGTLYPYVFPTLQCGTIDVPLDYTNADSEILTIDLIRIPSNSSTPLNKTIIYNPGGPGSSGIESLLQFADDLAVISGGGYHLASFDPRGVGHTDPYACPYDQTEYDYWYLPVTTPEGLNATYYQDANQGEICAQKPYSEAGQLIGTAFTARDVDAIFQALDEDGLIRYWGFSYGTALGDTIAAMFPDKIDRMVLDGNWNPTEYYHGPKDENVDDTDAELSFLFEACAEAGPNVCPLTVQGATGADLESIFYDTLNGIFNGTYALPSDATLPDGNPLTYVFFKSFIFQSLYSAANFPTIAQTISDVYSVVTTSSRVSRRQDSADFNVTEFFGPNIKNVQTNLNLGAISCGESDYILDGDLNDFQSLVYIHGNRSKFAGDQFVQNAMSCATWNVTAKEVFSGKFENIQTNNPILFVNSNRDPVTPLVSAKNSSSGFVGSGVVQHIGSGHCSTGHPSNCVNQKVKSYWLNGTIPDTSEVCQPNVPNPFLGDVSTPVNITEGTNSSDTRETERFNKAVANLGKMNHLPVKRSTFDVTAELSKKRDVKAPVMPRQATSTASCTSITAITPSATASGSGSGSKNAGARTMMSGSAMVAVVITMLFAFLS